ncbi:hypothetical protein ACFU8W_16525 [Streptomyces sp. NPDC057565]|uniref:hypothetical protein n=1 Tax=Streptomyces sp. NPDC057565 TaxID=3346169 RepID=UPI0036B5B01D
MTNPQPPQQPFLTMHTALILLIALVLGAAFGALTFLTAESVAAAVLAGLTTTGVSIPVLRTLVSPDQ